MNTDARLRIATVMDAFTHSCFAPECDLLQLSPSHWADEIAAFHPELLLVESAWFGKNGLWHRKISEASPELLALVEHCKQQAIPTVFWCKEDPVHFHRFLATASRFDTVFSTDINCLPLYKQLLGHTRVHLLPFACQPKEHNPLETALRKDAACFAGSYYVRYPERARDLEAVVDAVAAVKPVIIYDRYHNSTDENYRFPGKYQPLIQGSLPPEQIDIAYKGYRYGINLNTVKGSASMFARRVFELLASGTVTISNESPGIRKLFGELVVVGDAGYAIEATLSKLAADVIRRDKLALAGLRKVMLEHTYAQRLARIRQKVLGHCQPDTLPRPLIIASVWNGSDVEHITRMLLAQRATDWRALLFLPTGEAALATCVHSPDPRIELIGSLRAGVRIGDLIEDEAWVAGFSPSDYYGPNYLLDLLLATRYGQADAFGKGSFFRAESECIRQLDPNAVYRPLTTFALRRATIRANCVQAVPVADWLAALDSGSALVSALTPVAMALDAFSYCENARPAGLTDIEISRVVDDELGNTGEPIEALYAEADASRVRLPLWLGKPSLRLRRLADVFGPATKGPLIGQLDSYGWHLVSEIPDGDTGDIWALDFLSLNELRSDSSEGFYVEAFPGMPIQLLVRFMTERSRFIDERVYEVNRNQQWAAPADAMYVLLGWRVFSSGTTRVTRFALGFLPE